MADHSSNGVARPTALICDDDAMSRRLVREVLERCGYDTIAGVDNAIDALQLVIEHRPEVLVLDLALRGMSGEEIIEAIHTASDTQVIVHSAFDPRLAVKSGARLFARKGNINTLEKQLMRLRGIAASA